MEKLIIYTTLLKDGVLQDSNYIGTTAGDYFNGQIKIYPTGAFTSKSGTYITTLPIIYNVVNGLITDTISITSDNIVYSGTGIKLDIPNQDNIYYNVEYYSNGKCVAREFFDVKFYENYNYPKFVKWSDVKREQNKNRINKYEFGIVLDLTVSGSNDHKVSIDSNDNDADYLLNKLEAGDNITLTNDNNKIKIDSENNDTYEVKVSNNDATPNYLVNKIIAGNNITISEDISAWSDHKLVINASSGLSDHKVLTSSSDKTAGYLYDKLESTDISISIKEDPSDVNNYLVNLGASGTTSGYPNSYELFPFPVFNSLTAIDSNSIIGTQYSAVTRAYTFVAPRTMAINSIGAYLKVTSTQTNYMIRFGIYKPSSTVSLYAYTGSSGSSGGYTFDTSFNNGKILKLDLNKTFNITGGEFYTIFYSIKCINSSISALDNIYWICKDGNYSGYINLTSSVDNYYDDQNFYTAANPPSFSRGMNSTIGYRPYMFLSE